MSVTAWAIETTFMSHSQKHMWKIFLLLSPSSGQYSYDVSPSLISSMILGESILGTEWFSFHDSGVMATFWILYVVRAAFIWLPCVIAYPRSVSDRRMPWVDIFYMLSLSVMGDIQSIVAVAEKLFLSGAVSLSGKDKWKWLCIETYAGQHWRQDEEGVSSSSKRRDRSSNRKYSITKLLHVL